MRWLLPCLVILLLVPFSAPAQVAPQQGPSVTTTPSVFNIRSEKGGRFRVSYTFRIAAAGSVTLTSPKGSFTAGKEHLGTNDLLLTVNIERGHGEVTEFIEVPGGVVDLALEKGMRKFSYKRVFRGRQTSLTATVEFNIVIAGLTVKDIEIYFEGRKREVAVRKNHPLLRVYADIRLEGAGLLQGYWEVDGRVLSHVNLPLSHVRKITIEPPEAARLPTFEPGRHRVRFVVTTPGPRLNTAPVSYFVLLEGLDGIRDYVPGQVVVVLDKKGSAKGYPTRLSEKYGLKILDDYSLVSIGLRMILFEARGKDILKIIDAVRTEGIAVIAQPNHILRTMSDPLRKRQYGNDIMKVDSIHRLYTGRGVRVAVLDTGVDFTHKDIRGRIVSARNFVRDEEYRKEVHGTAVAGLVASGVNGFGIEGVAPGAKILAFRACTQKSDDRPMGDCFTDSLARALDTVIADDVDIVNMSFGGQKDELLARLIDRGVEKGILFVAPVGNKKSLKDLRFPASHPGVVSVGGVDEESKPYPNPEITARASVNAPAVNILTTFPADRYNFLSGTSLSAAYISGILALALEKDSGLDRDRLPVYKDDICIWEEELFGISLCRDRERRLQ